MLTKHVEELREEINCAQSTLIGICKNCDWEIDLDHLANLTVAFGGGIGGTLDEGTYGAVTGALIALCFIEKDPEKLSKYSKEFFNRSQDKYPQLPAT